MVAAHHILHVNRVRSEYILHTILVIYENKYCISIRNKEGLLVQDISTCMWEVRKENNTQDLERRGHARKSFAC